jgi:hypothetical protein
MFLDSGYYNPYDTYYVEQPQKFILVNGGSIPVQYI